MFWLRNKENHFQLRTCMFYRNLATLCSCETKFTNDQKMKLESVNLFLIIINSVLSPFYILICIILGENA